MAFAPIFQRLFSATFDRRAAAAAAGNGLLNALIAYWPGNEASGTLYDAHTNGYTLLPSASSPTTGIGHVYAGARQYLAASTQLHSATNHALLEYNDTPFSVAGWLYMTSYAANGRSLFQASFDARTCYWLRVIGDPAPLNVTIYSATVERQISWSSNLALNTWTSYVVRYDDASRVLSISVNGGMPLNAAALTGAMRTKTTESLFKLGNSPGRNFDGLIGPTAFWRRVLSTDDIAAWHNGGAGLAYSQFTT